jgi:hypothetical protein
LRLPISRLQICDIELEIVSEALEFIEEFKVANCDLELSPPASLGAFRMPLAERALGNAVQGSN